MKSVLIGEATRSFWFMGVQTENLLDRAGHVDLRVEGASSVTPAPVPRGSPAADVGADDIARAAVTVDVVNAVLRVVFLDEDRRRWTTWAVADGVDKAANGQVVIGLHGCRVRRPAGVVGADPHELQLGHRAVSATSFCEVLLPDIEAVLVGDAQIELREVLDRVAHQVRERGVRADGVVVLELLLLATLVFQCVVVELGPGRLAAVRNKKR